MRGLRQLVVAHGGEVAPMPLETAGDAPVPRRDSPAEARDVVAADRHQAAHLLLQVLVAGRALGGELLLVLLQARLDPPAAYRDLGAELLDVGRARGRTPGDAREEHHADHQRAKREPSRHRRTPRGGLRPSTGWVRSEEHTSELQSPYDLVCRLLLEKKKKTNSMRARAHKKIQRHKN